MRILKATILTLSFLFFTNSLVKAQHPTPVVDKTVDFILYKYIESTTLGKTANLSEFMDDNFKHYVTQDEKVMSFNKNQFIKQLNLTKNFIMNCSTNYYLIESTNNVKIAKVEMKFPKFKKDNYVTMTYSDDSWKIVNVTTLYS